MPRPAADTDTTKHSGILGIPGTDSLPFRLNLRIEAKTERDRNLACTSLEAAQVNTLTGCNAGFLWPQPEAQFSLKSLGTLGRGHVDIDYDSQREFDASNTFSLSYQGQAGDRLQRVDAGIFSFAAPPSRFMTSTAPAGNYGVLVTHQFGDLRVQSVFGRETGNVVLNRRYTMGARAEQQGERTIEDYQIERLHFFFTVDPSLFGAAFPNIDILNRSQLTALSRALPDTLRPSRVLLYRLQFGTQPQNPNGPQFRIAGDPGRGRQTYDLLREGVDYVMDQSQLWFALVRPLNETNERLLIAYYVRLHGRDTVWTTTGGTPDLAVTKAHDQVANLVMDPSVGPSSPAFNREIRSVYRVAGEDLVRQRTRVRIVTGGGRLEHPIAGTDATFLQMLGLAQATSPADFDYENRLWPRASDPVFNLGAGAIDVRNGQSMNAGRLIREQFLVFPSLRPFSARTAGLVAPGNPTNDAIYTSPGEYLYSAQHPASVYRISLQYESTVGEESRSLTLGATQVRPGSERVLVDGRATIRELDYRIDYDLGRIDFTRPDTLFRQPRTIDVRFEENPGFSPTPTTLAGIVSTLPLRHGVINFTALNQQQQTSETRPQLGFQGSSNLTTGLSGDFAWDAPALTRFVSRLPFGRSTVPSRIAVHGEIASSHPQFLARNNGASYVDDFDGASGINIPLGDINWYLSSLPAYGNSLRSRFGAGFFEPNRAASIVWQTNAQALNGARAVFKRSQIDPLTDLIGAGVELNEPVLWLTLLPLRDQGRYDKATRRYDWTLGNTPTGRRFRSMRAVLRSSGMDLTRGEYLEFWTLVDTSITGRAKNPTVIFDFGDVSENSLTFAPETLTIRRNANGTVDSVFTGRKLQGLDSLDTERDPFSKSFNFEVNDTGLPGDVVDTLVVIDGANVRRETKVRLCRGAAGALNLLGDPRSNCTIGNAHLDEEDIDLDNTLNFNSAARESERILRYVVDLSDPAKYKRLGGTYTDSVLVDGVSQPRTRRWTLVSIPFGAPTDSLNDVNRRRVRAVRLTLVSGAGQLDDEPTQLPLAEVHVTGAPWLDRSPSALAGIAGIRPDGGFVITSTIGTNDSSATLVYQPPPGVIDQAEFQGAQFGAVRTPINERSLRLQTGNLQLYHRAEAFLRFPAGPQSYTGFQTLHVWGRGRGNGWGPGADLQMYIKIGRDENNFYMYRAAVPSGATAAAWSDLGIDFGRLIALRKKIQTDYLAGKKESIACSGVDSLLIAASPLPTGVVSHRFAACDDGYMVYTADPAVTAPDLASVQELAVGIVRVGAGGGPSGTLPGDTLELWVDDVRLTQPHNASGLAQAFNVDFNAGDLADLHLSFSNRDPNFRQLGEQPSFLSERNIGVVGTINLDRFLPRGLGLALPLTINTVSVANDPLYLTQTDISASGVPGVRKPLTRLTNYSVTVRRSSPVNGGMLASLVNNLSATTSYVTGVDRTEYQDGKAHNLSVSLDYLVTDDSARTVQLPLWLRGSAVRWNPTQLSINSGFMRATDRRTSFIKPASAPDDPPSLAEAQTRLWRNGSVLEFRPTNGFTARWEVQSVRDLRDYGDTTALTSVATRQRQTVFGANAGFERERALITSFAFAPVVSSWLHPRGELGTQYNMLRDPNARSLMPLPGVVVVDSILAARDSLAVASSLTLPRRMSAAQTASAGAQVDVARAFAAYTADSSVLRGVGRLFSPIDVSYTRSLLSALDAAAVDAPLAFQFGLGGPRSFRSINGTTSTTSGQTGLFAASEALLLPYGTSLVNRFTRTTTTNWIARDDQSQAQVDGAQRVFPDASLQWAFRPAPGRSALSSVAASVGFMRSDVTISLPSLIDQAPSEIRHTHIETFPVAGSIAFAGGGAFSTGARLQWRRQIDTLPSSVARSNGNDFSVDAGHVFHIPAHDGLRTRFTFQLTHNTTTVFDSTGSVRARLQDNGRRTFTLTADTRFNEQLVLTFNGSDVLTFDHNLNRRFEYTVFSAVFQWQPFDK
jgi:cell surface protein SprA